MQGRALVQAPILLGRLRHLLGVSTNQRPITATNAVDLLLAPGVKGTALAAKLDLLDREGVVEEA